MNEPRKMRCSLTRQLCADSLQEIGSDLGREVELEGKVFQMAGAPLIPGFPL